MEKVGDNDGFIGPLGNWSYDMQTSDKYDHNK